MSFRLKKYITIAAIAATLNMWPTVSLFFAIKFQPNDAANIEKKLPARLSKPNF